MAQSYVAYSNFSLFSKDFQTQKYSVLLPKQKELDANKKCAQICVALDILQQWIYVQLLVNLVVSQRSFSFNKYTDSFQITSLPHYREAASRS